MRKTVKMKEDFVSCRLFFEAGKVYNVNAKYGDQLCRWGKAEPVMPKPGELVLKPKRVPHGYQPEYRGDYFTKSEGDE